MTGPESDMLFVGIKQPDEIRRNILESSKSMIVSLQKYEKIKLLREEKEKEIFRLKAIIKEIDEAMNNIKNSLPKTSLEPLTEEDEIRVNEKLNEITEKMEDVRLKTEKKEEDREELIREKELDAIRRIREKKKGSKKEKDKKKAAPVKIPKMIEPVIKVSENVKVLTPYSREPIKPQPRQELNDLEKLEQELKAIESKLDGL